MCHEIYIRREVFVTLRNNGSIQSGMPEVSLTLKVTHRRLTSYMYGTLVPLHEHSQTLVVRPLMSKCCCLVTKKKKKKKKSWFLITFAFDAFDAKASKSSYSCFSLKRRAYSILAQKKPNKNKKQPPPKKKQQKNKQQQQQQKKKKKKVHILKYVDNTVL